MTERLSKIPVVLLLCLFFAPRCDAWTVPPTTPTTTSTMTRSSPSSTTTKRGRSCAALLSSQNENFPGQHPSQDLGPPSSSSVADDRCRRAAIFGIAASFGTAAFAALPSPSSAAATVDVNNAMAREFTAFPGLFPTIATKIVTAAKKEPFKSKKDVYAILNDVERERLKQYDSSIVVNKPDLAVRQFKASQICKYECGGRASSSFRDEQIREVQRDRY